MLENLEQKQHWKSNAVPKYLRQRSAIIDKIRAFFAARGVLEVETPLLCSATATDPHINSFGVLIENNAGEPPALPGVKVWYLQTSPEFPMKRLLVQGIGSIYQISKAFRASERGRFHNPEFTLLEWYREGFNHHQLMDEIDELMYDILCTPPADRITYAEAFYTYLGVDPFQSTIDDLRTCAKDQNFVDLENYKNESKDFWLQLLMSHYIEPHLGKNKPVFVIDFPSSQAALAKINAENPLLADRFELYFKGVELANGYHELCDAKEQRARFSSDIDYRVKHGMAQVPMDERLLAALEEGMPAAAGVALGVDRLVMLACGAGSVDEVISFTYENI